MKNKLSQYGRQFAAVAVISTCVAGNAFADATAAAAKITAGETNIGTLGWAAIGAVVAAAIFKYMRRAV